MFKKSLEPWHLQANRHCKMEMETPLCTCNCTYLYIRQPQQSINLRFHLGKLKTDLAVRILKTLLKLLKMPTAQLFASWRVGQRTREPGREGHFRMEEPCMVPTPEQSHGQPYNSHLQSSIPGARAEAQVAVKHGDSLAWVPFICSFCNSRSPINNNLYICVRFQSSEQTSINPLNKCVR